MYHPTKVTKNIDFLIYCLEDQNLLFKKSLIVSVFLHKSGSKIYTIF